MKQIILTILIANILFLCKTQAQCNIQYTYDATGNRTQRANYTCLINPPENARIASNQTITKNETTPFIIFPNPTQGIIHIQLPNANPATPLTITNIEGKIVHQAPLSDFKADISHLCYGTYFLQIIHNNITYNAKIIKQ